MAPRRPLVSRGQQRHPRIDTGGKSVDPIVGRAEKVRQPRHVTRIDVINQRRVRLGGIVLGVALSGVSRGRPLLMLARVAWRQRPPRAPAHELEQLADGERRILVVDGRRNDGELTKLARNQVGLRTVQPAREGLVCAELASCSAAIVAIADVIDE